MPRPRRLRRQLSSHHWSMRRQPRLSRAFLAILVTSLLITTTSAATSIRKKTKKQLRGQLSPSELAKRERDRLKAEQCLPQHQELCGNGQGVLVCEFNPETSYYASRCVKRSSHAKHVALHPKNYCGACHKCFQNAQELQSAVHKYVANNTASTSIAKIYGWPIGSWCVDPVTDFSNLFSNQHDFNEDIGGWDVRRATTLRAMFWNAFSFNQDLSDWNTERVTDMAWMFDRAYQFAGYGLGQWNTSRVTTLQRTFRIAKQFVQDVSGWDTRHVTDMSLLFYRAESLNQPLHWNVERVTDFSYAFSFCREFNQSSLANWTTSAATTMRGMFQSADSFAQDLSGWDVSKVTDMSYMFSNAIAFDQYYGGKKKEKLLLQAWDLANVQHREQMFGVIAPSFNQSTPATSSHGVTSPSRQEGMLQARQATSTIRGQDPSVSSF